MVSLRTMVRSTRTKVTGPSLTSVLRTRRDVEVPAAHRSRVGQAEGGSRRWRRVAWPRARRRPGRPVSASPRSGTTRRSRRGRTRRGRSCSALQDRLTVVDLGPVPSKPARTALKLASGRLVDGEAVSLWRSSRADRPVPGAGPRSGRRRAPAGCRPGSPRHRSDPGAVRPVPGHELAAAAAAGRPRCRSSTSGTWACRASGWPSEPSGRRRSHDGASGLRGHERLGARLPRRAVRRARRPRDRGPPRLQRAGRAVG